MFVVVTKHTQVACVSSSKSLKLNCNLFFWECKVEFPFLREMDGVVVDDRVGIVLLPQSMKFLFKVAVVSPTCGLKFLLHLGSVMVWVHFAHPTSTTASVLQ